jgi:hypothetical protein
MSLRDRLRRLEREGLAVDYSRQGHDRTALLQALAGAPVWREVADAITFPEFRTWPSVDRSPAVAAALATQAPERALRDLPEARFALAVAGTETSS